MTLLHPSRVVSNVNIFIKKLYRGPQIYYIFNDIFGHMLRDLHGLANPHESRVRVAAGMGVGWKFPTCQKPLPMGRVVWVAVGFFSGPPPPPPLPTTSSNTMRRLYSQVTVAQPMWVVLSFSVSVPSFQPSSVAHTGSFDLFYSIVPQVLFFHSESSSSSDFKLQVSTHCKSLVTSDLPTSLAHS